MSQVLCRGLLRRLTKWHLEFLRSPQRTIGTQDTASVQVPWASSGNSQAHDDPTIRQETLELAHNELRWMLEEAQRGIRPSSSHEHATQETAHSIVGRKLLSMVRRRVHYHEPLAYILGTQPFGSLSINVKPPLLIPRPETEEWTLQVVQRMQEALVQRTPERDPTTPRPFRVLDLCCGTGCIGLTIAKVFKQSGLPLSVHFVDKNNTALECVMDNSKANEVTSEHLQVSTVQMDIMGLSEDQLTARFAEMTDSQGFDLILCNPPYIPTSDYDNLDASVKDWEDRDALCGDDGGTTDGLAFFRRIVSLLTASKSHRGFASRTDINLDRMTVPNIVFEVGKGQHEAVEAMLSNTPFATKVEVWQDAFGVQRAVAGYFGSVKSTSGRD